MFIDGYLKPRLWVSLQSIFVHFSALRNVCSASPMGGGGTETPKIDQKGEEGGRERGREDREGRSLCCLMNELYQGAKGLL